MSFPASRVSFSVILRREPERRLLWLKTIPIEHALTGQRKSSPGHESLSLSPLGPPLGLLREGHFLKQEMNFITRVLLEDSIHVENYVCMWITRCTLPVLTSSRARALPYTTINPDQQDKKYFKKRIFVTFPRALTKEIEFPFQRRVYMRVYTSEVFLLEVHFK